jgi:hypothetical protein
VKTVRKCVQDNLVGWELVEMEIAHFLPDETHRGNPFDDGGVKHSHQAAVSTTKPTIVIEVWAVNTLPAR